LACRIHDESALDAHGRISRLFDEGIRHRHELGDAAAIHGNEVSGYVAFTFDDGPSYVTTPSILRALVAYDVPATFFVLGRRLRGEGTAKNLATLHEIIAGGFLVGNHTVNHRALARLRSERAQAEIDDNGRIVGQELGYQPRLFRPPYGSNSAQVRQLLANGGYTEVLWSIDPRDFSAAGRKTLRKRVGAEILRRNGGVVLLHDIKRVTSRVIAGILDDLEANNCQRLAAAKPLIVPVSLHYFLREHDGATRPVPAAVHARTEAYLTALPARCLGRTVSAVRVDFSDHPH
jgi:peptidoglycan/xylan/chitin deacetylase (PgdA/CDA1 family)